MKQQLLDTELGKKKCGKHLTKIWLPKKQTLVLRRREVFSPPESPRCIISRCWLQSQKCPLEQESASELNQENNYSRKKKCRAMVPYCHQKLTLKH